VFLVRFFGRPIFRLNRRQLRRCSALNGRVDTNSRSNGATIRSFSALGKLMNSSTGEVFFGFRIKLILFW
jgi:hypothetical protein